MAIVHERYEPQGFSVLAFPTNDFRQELPDNEHVVGYLQHNFPEISFPVFGLSELAENPVYQRLREHLPHEHVQHNFFKYLVDRRGIAVKLYHKRVDPFAMEADIEALLKEPVL